ncbi:MAG TPA: hypothetical protein CFH84_06070 [Sulfurimonas sp. UBA12504]|nr:MAG: hypothetical protein A2019_04665 [Sulfurimonas sp. GWF2_37_8]DAB30039.1 MAG TPA: hypothetical protein CFH84_06070 [Sulfurimonas sp. UBA12504]
MMNNANEISRQTKLYGYIGEHAGSCRFSAVINKIFKENADDAMMIPMNIREDDLYFTVSNIRQSHLHGVIISNEYTQSVVEILDEASELVKRSGMCDIIYKKEEKLRGDIFSLRALNEHLKDLLATKIAIIGVNSYAKAFAFLACGFSVSYFHENLEELMTFTKEVDILDADLNRLAPRMSVDLSGYDAVLDFSDIQNFEMIEKLPKHNLDMKNDKQFSALKQRVHELGVSYTSTDMIIDKFCVAAYRAIKK